MAKMIQCKTCGASIAANAKTCPSCGAKNKKTTYKYLLVGFLVLFAIGIIGSISSKNTNHEISTSSSTLSTNSASSIEENKTPSVDTRAIPFEGDCGISASATIGNSIIGYPELKISIINNSSQNIKAITFYAVPIDVYGEEIKGWTTQSKLYTDDTISANGSTNITYQFIEASIKSVELYVYSVYFADGTEWGNHDAVRSDIQKYGVPINVEIIE